MPRSSMSSADQLPPAPGTAAKLVTPASNDSANGAETRQDRTIVAGVVAFVTHSTLKTLATGMLTLWVLQLAGSAFG